MFDLKGPCTDCPFLKAGGIRLTPGRVREIAACFTDWHGATFYCHKTTEEDDDGDPVRTGREQMCAGGLVFALKQHKMNQMARIGSRIGWNPDTMIGHDRVFDSLTAMLRTAVRR